MRRFLIAAALTAAPALYGHSISLTTPVGGERVPGGSLQTLQWRAGALPPHADEWEAFLSLDGGQYYSVRITPHLDIATRVVVWRVPNISSRSAKILLRIGDERDETVIELPERFSIVADGSTVGASSAAIRQVDDEEAEPARPGEPNVAAWAVGGRNARSFVYHQRRDTTRSFSNLSDPLLTASPAEVPAQSDAFVPRSGAPIQERCQSDQLRGIGARLFTADILLQSRRRNI